MQDVLKTDWDKGTVFRAIMGQIWRKMDTISLYATAEVKSLIIK
jgi:hypothetical protein